MGLWKNETIDETWSLCGDGEDVEKLLEEWWLERGLERDDVQSDVGCTSDVKNQSCEILELISEIIFLHSLKFKLIWTSDRCGLDD